MLGIILAQAAAPIVNNNEPSRLTDLETVFTNVVKAAIPGAGIVLFIILLFAGLNYMSAGDDPKKVASARAMITYAIIGMVVISMAYLILRLVALFTGVDSILNFQIAQ
jgi:hypothetical protein